MYGLRTTIAAALLSVAFSANAAHPTQQDMVGIWYGTHVQPDVASAPLHWKLWRQSDGRFVIDYYVQAGCFLSYSHREIGRWELRRGVHRVITEQIGERKLDQGSKGYSQRFKILEASADRMRFMQQGADVDLLLTRIPADFHMDTMNLCPAEESGS
jgi:hypothetical protein